ncbi:G protein-coupled glucose receptor regulating gpa2 domain-containing protein [Apiospora marii]|uniref:G protein-coupled glucose receptor regulating gpa2 domain-containing protein n=1 Tax=Apiospora marii TaxID=335849 RepID=UPI00312EDC66
MAPITLAVAIPTLAGSILSLLADTVALVAHLVAPPGETFPPCPDLEPPRRRINALNNSISGVVMMLNLDKPEPLSPGLACNINAFVGQFSVQAVDFNILIMSVTVLLTLRTRKLSTEPTRLTMLAICALAWVPSVITSSIGLGLDAYGPVSGNWCWIEPQRTALRYALTHSWRMAIFLVTLIIYTYIYVHLRRTFKRFALSTTTRNLTNHNDPADLPVGGRANDNPDTTETSDIIVKKTFYIDAGVNSPTDAMGPSVFASAGSGAKGSKGSHIPMPPIPLQDLELGRRATVSQGAALNARQSTFPDQGDRQHVHGGARHASNSNLRRMLLLNGYPVLYIVLWIPGIATRLVEAVRGSSPVWLVVMQSSTQYVGLANALTYCWNEKATQRLKRLVG